MMKDEGWFRCDVTKGGERGATLSPLASQADVLFFIRPASLATLMAQSLGDAGINTLPFLRLDLDSPWMMCIFVYLRTRRVRL